MVASKLPLGRYLTTLSLDSVGRDKVMGKLPMVGEIVGRLVGT